MELERDVYNKDSLMIPMLEDGRGPADEEEEVSKFPPKGQKHFKHNFSGEFLVRPSVAGMKHSNFNCNLLLNLRDMLNLSLFEKIC